MKNIQKIQLSIIIVRMGIIEFGMEGLDGRKYIVSEGI